MSNRVNGFVLTKEDAQVIRDMAGTLRAVFRLLNSYARKDDMQLQQSVSPFAVLGEVYGNLASGFTAFTRVADSLEDHNAH